MIICLVLGALIQKSLLEPYRGQAMAMPIIKTYIVSIILILIYVISFLCNKYIKSIFYIFIAFVFQLILIDFTIHKYIFYWNLIEGNIPIHDWDSDYFPPPTINFYTIAIFSMVIIGFYLKVIIKATND